MEKLEEKLGQIDPRIADVIGYVQKAGQLLKPYTPTTSDVRNLRSRFSTPRLVPAEAGSYVLTYN